MLIKTLRKGDTAVLLCMLRDADGTPFIASDLTGSPVGQVSVALKRDFFPFDSVSLQGATTSLYDPPRGTTAVPDPRWVPGIDGEDGFNVQAIIPGVTFSTAGTYLATVKITKGGSLTPPVSTAVFRIHVGTGQ